MIFKFFVDQVTFYFVDIIVTKNVRKLNRDEVDSILMKAVASSHVNPRFTLETVRDIEGELASYEKVR